MRRTTALLVPLLLVAVVALTAATVAQPVPGDGQAPLVADYDNSSYYLTSPTEDVRGSHTVSAGLDAGLSVGIDGRDLQNTHEMETFRQRFATADTDANRSAAYDAILATLEERADTLRERDAQANRAYADGRITTDSFLRERAVIVAEASRLQGMISELRAVESETLGFELSDSQQSRLREVNGQLAIVRGPIAEQVAELASGGSSPQAVYVENSSSGHVVALVEGDTYVREAYLGDEIAPGAEDQFQSGNGTALENARQRALTLYPHTTASSVEPFGSTYAYNGVFSGGRLTVYLDGGTGNAFREHQRLNASTLPVAITETTTNESTTLRVNRTFPTGPMEIELVDAGTGAPIDGTVSIDGTPIGRTGADGSLWAVEPRASAQVQAPTDDATVSLTVSGT
jgi:hypothetical protein